MSVLVIIFGALILAAGAVIIVNPDIVFGFIGKHREKLEIHILAVLVRLVLGALLIYLSDASRFPLIITIIGWISIIAAIALAVIGRTNFKRLISWAMSLQKPYGRIGGIVAVCFGGFLIYAYV